MGRRCREGPLKPQLGMKGGVLQTIVALFNEGTAFQVEVSGGRSYYPDLEVVYVSPRSTNNRNVKVLHPPASLAETARSFCDTARAIFPGQ